jgi:phospholipid/cholesterol/gamma-HCH transport system ATP-binding protein
LFRRFGVLFQSGALLGGMTVGDNVALPLIEFTGLPPQAIRAVVQAKLAQVGLAGSAHLFPAQLSGGMRKRAGLARAMALDPDLLFFDEPSSGLDPVLAADLDRLIMRLRDTMGTTMVVVTHDLDSAFTVADRVILLDRARRTAVAEGRPGELAVCGDAAVAAFFSRAGLRSCPAPQDPR